MKNRVYCAFKFIDIKFKLRAMLVYDSPIAKEAITNFLNKFVRRKNAIKRM